MPSAVVSCDVVTIGPVGVGRTRRGMAAIGSLVSGSFPSFLEQRGIALVLVPAG